MAHPLHDLVAQPIEQLARRVENILDEDNQAQILGPRMVPALGTGPPRALVKLALLNDCLRVIESAVAADRGTARDKVEAVYPLLKAIAAVYARVRRDYQPFARLTAATVSRFLKFHYRDSRVFGNACEKTRWLGRDVCHRAAALGRTPDLLAAYERMTAGLMQYLLHPTPAPPPAPEVESEEVALGAGAEVAPQPPGEQAPTSSAIRRYEGFNVEDSDDQIALAPPPPAATAPPSNVSLRPEEPVLAEEEPVVAEVDEIEPAAELAEEASPPLTSPAAFDTVREEVPPTWMVPAPAAEPGVAPAAPPPPERAAAEEVAEEILLEEEPVLAEAEESGQEPVEDLAPVATEEVPPPPATAHESETEAVSPAVPLSLLEPPEEAAEPEPAAEAEPLPLESDDASEEVAEEILLDESVLTEAQEPVQGPAEEVPLLPAAAPDSEPEALSPAAPFWAVDQLAQAEPEPAEAVEPPPASPFAFDGGEEVPPVEDLPAEPAEAPFGGSDAVAEEVAEEILLDESVLTEAQEPVQGQAEEVPLLPATAPESEPEALSPAAPFWAVDQLAQAEPEPAEAVEPPPASPFAFDGGEEVSPVEDLSTEPAEAPFGGGDAVAEEVAEEILLDESVLAVGPESAPPLASPVPPGAELEDVPLATPVWPPSPPEEPVPAAVVSAPPPEATPIIEEEAEAILLEEEATLAEEEPATRQAEQVEPPAPAPGEEATPPFASSDLFAESEEVPLAAPAWPPAEEAPVASAVVEPFPLESEPVAELEPAPLPTAEDDLDAAVAALLAEAEAPAPVPAAAEPPSAGETAEDHARRGATLRRQGDREQAITELEEAIRLDPAGSDPATSEWYSELARARAERGEPAALQALECYHLGRSYADRGVLGAVVACLEESLALDPRLPWAHNELARHLATWPVTARRDGPAAVRLATTACELSGGNCWVFLDTLAAAGAQAGDFQQAAVAAEKALAMAPPEEQAGIRARLQRYAAGQPPPGSAAAAGAGAVNFDPAEAEDEPSLCDNLAALEARLGLLHPRTLQALAALGRLCHRGGRYREAACLLKRAVRLEEKSRGRDEAAFAESLHLLGETYWRLERDADAVPCYEQALAIRQKVFGPDDPDVVESIHHLGRTYSRLGRLDEAERLYRQAVALREQTLGPDHPEVANVLCDLAELQSQRQRVHEACSLLEQALAIRTAALGADHEETARVQTRLQQLEAAGT
jgi:tetratricopeptide (TPR) repeat protein